MSTRTIAALGLAGALLAAITVARSSRDERPSLPSSPSPSLEASARNEERTARVTTLRLENPALDAQQADALTEQSDRMQETLDALGERDVRTLLRETEVSETEARAYFEDNRALFGGRSFEASRVAIERLVALDRVSAQLDVE